MDDLDYCLDDRDLNGKELLILSDLIKFYQDENAITCDLSKVEENIALMRDKLNLFFLDLLRSKVSLIRKEEELKIAISFLFGEFKNYDDFYKKIGLRVDELRSVVENVLDGIQDKTVLTNIQKKLHDMETAEQVSKTKIFKLCDEFLYVYLNSRHCSSVIKEITSLNVNGFLDIINSENLNDNYPEDIKEMIESKRKILKSLKVSRVASDYPIRELELVRIVKPDVVKIPLNKYKMLEKVVQFLKNNGNIFRMGDNYNTIFCILDLDELRGLLNEDTYNKVKNYLLVEEKLQSLFARERKELIEQMIIKYYMCNGNIIRLIECGEQEEEILRLLSDDLAVKILGCREYEKVSKSLKEYKEKEEVLKVMRKIKEPVVISRDI